MAYSSELLSRQDSRHVIHPQTSLLEHATVGPKAIIVRGEGAVIEDANGKKYIDGLAGLWNINVGHGRRELAQAAFDQMSQLAFTSSFNGFSNPPAIELASRLASLAPGDLNVVLFASGGSEANDQAFKLVRYYWKTIGQPGRYKVISRRLGYHGITIAATSATGIQPFWDMAPPLAPGFSHVMPPYCFRCELGLQFPACALACAAELERQILAEGPETVAAFLAEPVQGAGGVIVPPPGYLQAVREVCDRHGILFIADEVICGFGRTGRMFGVEHSDVVPDLMTFAKGVTSGYIPLGGVILTERIFSQMAESAGRAEMAHGYTYTGHATACAVALANLDIIEREGLVDHARAMGDVLLEGLRQLAAEQPLVGNVRGLGLIAGAALVQNRETGAAFPAELRVARRVFEACRERGLIPRAAIGDVIALAPPLVITAEQVQQMLDILSESLTVVTRELRAEGRLD